MWLPPGQRTRLLILFDKLKGIELTTVHQEAQAHNATRQFAHVWTDFPCGEMTYRVAVQLVSLASAIACKRFAVFVFDLNADCAARARVRVDRQLIAAKTKRLGD